MNRQETLAQIAVFTTDRTARDVIKEALRNFLNIEATYVNGNIRRAIGEPESVRAKQIVIVDLAEETNAPQAIRELVEVCPASTAVLAIGRENDIRLYRKLIDAGANDYMYAPLQERLVTKSLRDWMGRQSGTANSRLGKSILITGVRGGCGSSTLAMRLARELSHNPPKPVLLADLDFIWGDLALQCDAKPNEALYSILAAGIELDDLALKRAVLKIDDDLDLLAASAPLNSAVSMPSDLVSRLLLWSATEYRYLVGEIPPEQLARAFPLNVSCEALILVSDTRPVCARDVARWRQWLAEQDNPPSVLHVLNMSGARNGLTQSEFTSLSGVAPDIVMPYMPALASGSLLGITNDQAYSRFDLRLGRLISRLATVAPTNPGLFSMFTRLLAIKDKSE